MDLVWRGASFRRARMLAGKSIADVADYCEVTQGAVSGWELGLANPSPENLERLSHLYDMPIDTLLDRPDAPVSVHEWYERLRESVPYESRRKPSRPGGHRTVKGEVRSGDALPDADDTPAFRRRIRTPVRTYPHRQHEYAHS